MVAVCAAGTWVLTTGYLEVVGDWLTRDVSADTFLWPLVLGWWGRVGKVLQFVAGLTVLLDLVGPEKLRAVGLRASREVEQFRSVRAENQFAHELERVRHLTGVRFAARYDDTSATYFSAMGDPGSFGWQAVPDDAPFTEEQYLAAHERFAAERGEHCGHAEHPRICSEQLPFLTSVIEELITAGLTEDERRQWDAVIARTPRHPALTYVSFVVAISAFIAVGTWTSQDRGGPRVVQFALLFATLVVWLNIMVDSAGPGRTVRRVVMWLRYGVVAASAPVVADLLDAARPAHRLRWAGFILFAIGFHFDLLAS
ncbi:hypothetical protein Kisp01_33800 [Kineosporia sp. NBRC 101677]|nr:hypothetical protein Kisp01_33800 [Kineosporia sp. NBRC 101677]